MNAAEKKYRQVTEEIVVQIEDLKQLLVKYNARHPNKDWMNVGDMECVLEELQQVIEFLSK